MLPVLFSKSCTTTKKLLPCKVCFTFWSHLSCASTNWHMPNSTLSTVRAHTEVKISFTLSQKCHSQKGAILLFKKAWFLIRNISPVLLKHCCLTWLHDEGLSRVVSHAEPLNHFFANPTPSKYRARNRVKAASFYKT